MRHSERSDGEYLRQRENGIAFPYSEKRRLTAKQGTQWASTCMSLGFTIAAAMLWWSSLHPLDVHRLTDLGLISVLPPTMFISLGLLTAGFVLSLCQRRLRWPLLVSHLVVLILMLYGTTTLIESVPRFASGWKHAGLTEFILRTRHIDPTVYPDFSWPGFFSLSALAVSATGAASPIGMLAWAPVVFNLLYLGPLILIFRSITRHQRIVWLGTWFFYVTNWVGQDYFSPQAFAYFLYLVMLGIILYWFGPDGPRAGTMSGEQIQPDGSSGLIERARRWLQADFVTGGPSTPTQRAGLTGLVILLYVVMVSSHALTSIVVCVSVAVLVAVGQSRARGLPIIMAVILGTWTTYLAVGFLTVNLATLTGQLGQVHSTVNTSVTTRLQGSYEHLIVLRARLVMAASVWLLALLGAIWRQRHGARDVRAALLAATPFAMLAFAPYGGEILLRIYFFSLPFVAFFVASLFLANRSDRPSWMVGGSICLVSLVLIGGFFLTRYGNERSDAFSPQELAAVRDLYRIAPPGSLLVTAVANLPWQFQDFEEYGYESLMDTATAEQLRASPDDPAVAVQRAVQLMRDPQYPNAYLIITRSQAAYIDQFGLLPPGGLRSFESALEQSPNVRLVMENDDAKIFAIREKDAGQP